MTPNKSVLLLAASGLALSLSACKVDNRPLLARGPADADAYAALPQPGLPGGASYGAPAYGANAYPASYLPPERAYPYAERAYGLDRAFYREPPDYGFAYADEQPWAWQAADDSLMFAEPYDDGYRAYYYEPGADYPYFVRDPNYGYALGQNGVLLALFDAAGALISGGNYDRYAPNARQYWSRGYDLHSAYGRAPRYGVDQAVWSQRAPRLEQFQQSWIAAPERQPAWRQWRAAAGPATLQHYAVQHADRAAAFNPGHQDNGGHLGWDRGQRQGENRSQQAFAAPPQPRLEAPRAIAQRDAGRQHGGDPGRSQQAAQRFNAPAVQGRDASFRGPDRHAAQAQPFQPPQHGGEGRGGHGGGQGHQVQAQPQPQAQQQAQQQQVQQHGGGQGHGQPAHAPPAQPAQGQPGPDKHGQDKQDGDHSHHHGG
jgi:hypothetical protein